MHIRTALAAAAVATLFSAPTFGAAIVNFSVNNTTGTNPTRNLNGVSGPVGSDFSSVLAFADGVANGPVYDTVAIPGFPTMTVASSYYAVGATGAGGRRLDFDLNPTSGPDRIAFVVNAAQTNKVAEYDLLLLVYRANFAALSNEQVVFDANSSMSNSKASLPAGTTFNFVVKDSGTFYMSTRQFTSTDTGPMVLNNLPSQTWVTFDPTNGGDGNIRSLASASSGGQTYSFNDVQAVGLYYEGATGTTGSRNIATNNWTVNASAVPEPGSIAVFGGALAFGILGRRKHA